MFTLTVSGHVLCAQYDSEQKLKHAACKGSDELLSHFACTKCSSMCGTLRCLGIVRALVVVSRTTTQLAPQSAIKSYICLGCLRIVPYQCWPHRSLQIVLLVRLQGYSILCKTHHVTQLVEAVACINKMQHIDERIAININNAKQQL